MGIHEGNFLKMRREAKGLTRNYVAKRLGFSAQFYGKIEKGLASLPVEYVKRFLKMTCSVQDYAQARIYYVDYMVDDYRDELVRRLK